MKKIKWAEVDKNEVMFHWNDDSTSTMSTVDLAGFYKRMINSKGTAWDYKRKLIIKGLK